MARKTHTSTAVKQRYASKAYVRYTISLRREEDAELIEYVEDRKDDIGTTELFRRGLELLVTGRGPED